MLGAHVVCLSAAAHRRAEQWLRARHGAVTIPGQPDAVAGLRYYLATIPTSWNPSTSGPFPGYWTEGFTVTEEPCAT